VEHFFGDKVAAINDHYSRVIADTIEKYLFNEWANNKLSLVTLEQIISSLVTKISNEDKRITEVDIPKLEDSIRTNETAIQGIVNDYNNSNILVRTAIFNNRFTRVIELSKTLYAQKTELAALHIFSIPLCRAVKNKLDDLHNRVIRFINQTDELIDNAKQRMSNLADINVADDAGNNDGMENMLNPVIEFYSRQRMKSLENHLYCDREKMDSMSSVIRSVFVNSLQSDGRFMNVERMNGKALSHALLGEVYSQIKTFHDKLCVDPGEKVLGMPILRRLYQKYGNNSEALRTFAENVINASGVLTEIDDTEIGTRIDNNTIPQRGTNILIKRIVVSLPHTDDPDLAQFSVDLKDALENAIDGGNGASVTVDANGQNQNEITVINLVNAFPIRAIGSMPMLKAEYDRVIAQDPKNKIVLLTEGRDGDFRGIFARRPKSPAEIRNEKVPQLIVLLGLGKLVRDDATEEYGVGEKDFFGNATVAPWGESARKFTEMVYDDRLMGERKSQITKLFNEALADAFEGVDVVVRAEVERKRAELKDALMTQISAVMKEEAPARQAYNDFVKWTEAAVKSVLDYKPKA
jgi:hypothetical protein